MGRIKLLMDRVGSSRATPSVICKSVLICALVRLSSSPWQRGRSRSTGLQIIISKQAEIRLQMDDEDTLVTDVLKQQEQDLDTPVNGGA
jgi:hypothetical protein